MSYRRSYRGLPSASPRWLTVKYQGVCAVCGKNVEKGSRAWYEPSTRNLVHANLACAKPYGLTKQEWFGSPVSGAWVDRLAEKPICPAGGYVRDPGEDMADRWNESH